MFKKITVLLPAILLLSVYLKIPTVRAGESQLLTTPWRLFNSNGASEASQTINSSILSGQDTLRLTYNLRGTCILGGDASAIIFDQNGWKYISLSKYGKNCFDGEQTVSIPLSKFTGLNTSQPVGSFHSRFWYNKSFTVDIISAVVYNSSPSATSSPTISPIPTPEPVITGSNLLSSAWTLTGNNNAAEKYQTINSGALNNQTSINVSYNLHGACLLSGDASAIIFDQNGWKYTSLSKYGKNCFDGAQSVSIPLSDFTGLNTTQPVGNFHVRFWYPTSFTIDLNQVTVLGSTTLNPTVTPILTPTPTPTINPNPTNTPTPTPTVAPSKTWSIQSIDAMKDTKDAVCGQRTESWINQWLDKAVELGANYVAISTPYDNPTCGDAVNYTKLWIKAIRDHGLNIWFRQMPLAFEGIYDTPKSNASDFLNQIQNYIKNNAGNYQAGDIFTPIPEPQNGGIGGVTGCAQNVCQFSSAAAFNQWLRNAMTTANNAFNNSGLGGKVKIGYFGFDGYVAWGDNNPDWNGILEDATVAQMGNITIDHYPEVVNDTMANDLKEVNTRYQGIDIIIGEWGTISPSTDVKQQVQNSLGAAKNNPSVKGINYWQFGPSGSGEPLIKDGTNGFVNNIQFSDVQGFYKPK